MQELPFGFEQPEDSPGFLLWQTTQLWQRQIKIILDPFGISHAQFVIMATVMWFHAHHQDTTQTRIAQWTKLDKMTVSASLKKLSGMGFTMRIENTQDARAKTVKLTGKGASLVQKLVPMIEAFDEKFFGKLPSFDQTAFIHALKQLTD